MKYHSTINWNIIWIHFKVALDYYWCCYHASFTLQPPQFGDSTDFLLTALFSLYYFFCTLDCGFLVQIDFHPPHLFIERYLYWFHFLIPLFLIDIRSRSKIRNNKIVNSSNGICDSTDCLKESELIKPDKCFFLMFIKFLDSLL